MPAINYKIRNCRPVDLPALVKLCKEHANYERTVYNPRGKSKLFGNALFSGKPSLYCWVVEINEEALDIFLTHLTFQHGRLQNFYIWIVYSSKRGTGVWVLVGK